MGLLMTIDYSSSPKSDNQAQMFFCVSIVLLAFSYVWGVVSTQHYAPSSSGFLISLYVILFSSLALILGFLKKPIVQIGHGTIAWLFFFGLILSQIVFHKLPYLDDHLLLSTLFIWCSLVSFFVHNLDSTHKKKAVHTMAIAIFVAAFCIVLSQFGQLFVPEGQLGFLLFPIRGDRLTSNVAQVNQAAYIVTLGIASIFYFLYNKTITKNWVWLLPAVSMMFFGIGLGFSASRGGIFLAIAALCSAGIFYQASIKKRLLMSVVFVPLVVLGYHVGTILMNQFLNTDLSAVGRLVGEKSLHLRSDLMQHAFLAFKSNPLFGVGFGNFKSFGLANAEHVNWFTAAHHAHNVVFQIGAELGLLGLVLLGYFAFILLKNLRFNLSPDKGFAYAVLMLTFLYSLSEFPLWYARYLILAVFFLAIIDASSFKLKFDFKKPLLVLSVLFASGSVYYIKDYSLYSSIAYRVIGGDSEEALNRFYKAPNTFGFGSYRDLTLYQIITVNEENLEQMIQMGNRVLGVHYDDFLILKQAHMLVAVGEQDRADAYFRALCIFNSGHYCQTVIDNLHALAEHTPENRGYLERFEKWFVERFNKPMPAKSAKADEILEKARL